MEKNKTNIDQAQRGLVEQKLSQISPPTDGTHAATRLMTSDAQARAEFGADVLFTEDEVSEFQAFFKSQARHIIQAASTSPGRPS